MSDMRLAGLPYDVRIVDRQNHAEGRTWLTDSRMEIADFPSPAVRDAVLLHEMIHIVVEVGHLGLEEAAIEPLASILYGFLADNGFWDNPDWWAIKRIASAE